MSSFKEKYQRFKQWQVNPFSYELQDDSTHRCVNCGHVFVGNFCPYCSQKAETGHITWKSVRRGMMELWGMKGRSMPYTLWQLFLRPGYLVGDYISGKRMVSFPPVKMLFILGTIIMLVCSWLEPYQVGQVKKEAVGDDVVLYVLNWLDTHSQWGLLIVNSFFIFPTWFLFRKAPRHPRHTLPEGFFIQVFMCIIMLVSNLLESLVGLFWNVSWALGLGIIIIYYYLTYRQLFGYGVWSTIWRLLLTFLITILLFFIAFAILIIFDIIIAGVSA